MTPPPPFALAYRRYRDGLLSNNRQQARRTAHPSTNHP